MLVLVLWHASGLIRSVVLPVLLIMMANFPRDMGRSARRRSMHLLLVEALAMT